MSKNERMVGISRRTLVKSTAIGSLALAAGGFSLPFTLRSAAAAVQQASEKVVWGACSVNCGSRCALRLHVKDNEVIWVETDNTGNDEYGNHQVRACLRGRSIRRRINHPDRLNYPMKRVGKRGEGKFAGILLNELIKASIKADEIPEVTLGRTTLKNAAPLGHPRLQAASSIEKSNCSIAEPTTRIT